MAELYALRPERMTVVPGARGWPEAYEYRMGGHVHRFKVHQQWPFAYPASEEFSSRG
ncbi:hypothetical protein JCM17845_00240 [Iodidimonas gelatinilytica]|uniref:Uncharacterized protein n=1 Tax=Iodidimonas gelatinilytica TaxID=1236966 RepID=A0A5A7MTY9_9PROT|nr:hypothetical protein JCM17845_00240 [Iodidimonas gelatinilytica]